MFDITRDCLSGPAELRKDRIIQPIVRKAVSLGKSLGPILYLVTVGVIATWVIGVFFGVGFFLLMHHHSEKNASQWGMDSGHFSASSMETPRTSRSITTPDQLFSQASGGAPGDSDLTVTAPEKKCAVTLHRDRQAGARAEPVEDQSAAQPEDRLLSADLGITPRVLGELSQVSPPPSQPSVAIAPRNVTLTPKSAAPRKPHQARATNIRSIRATAGVCDRCTEPSHRATHWTEHAKAKRSAF